jgi:hypothetical protein
MIFSNARERLQFLIDTDADSELIRTSLKEGSPANSRGEQGRTALHVAAGRGDFSLIDELIQRGADPDAACADGWTPACEAARFGHIEALNRLREYGALVDSARVLNELQKRERRDNPPAKILRWPEVVTDLSVQVDVECRDLARVIQAELRVGRIFEDSPHLPFRPTQGFVEIGDQDQLLMRANTNDQNSLHSPVAIMLRVRREFWDAGFFLRIAAFHPELKITGLSHDFGGWLFGQSLRYMDRIESVCSEYSVR